MLESRIWAEVLEFSADQLPQGWVKVLLVNEDSEKAALKDMCLCNCRGTLGNSALRVPSQVLIKQSAIGSGFLFYDLEPDASFAKEKSLVLLSLSQQSSENRKMSALALLHALRREGSTGGVPTFHKAPACENPIPGKNLLYQMFLHSK